MHEKPGSVQSIESSEDLARAIANAAWEKKAIEIEAMDVRKQVHYADFFLICSGRNEQHVRGIHRSIHKQLQEIGAVPLAMEGEEHNRWVLMDYGDAVIHVMLDSLRGLYELEKLWGESPRLDLGLPQQSYLPGEEDPFLDDDEF